MSIELVMPSNYLILCCPFSSCLRSFPASGSFPMSQFFASGGQSIGVTISASVLPMNIQDQLPLRLTGLISLQSKGLLRVFSNTTIQKLEKLDTTRKARKGQVVNVCGPSNYPFHIVILSHFSNISIFVSLKCLRPSLINFLNYLIYLLLGLQKMGKKIIYSSILGVHFTFS